MFDTAHNSWYCVCMEILSQLTRAIEASGVTRYRICKDLKINHGTLHRVVHGTGGCSMAAFNDICEYLGLELTLKKGE